jgi:hypothetical protein
MCCVPGRMSWYREERPHMSHVRVYEKMSLILFLTELSQKTLTMPYSHATFDHSLLILSSYQLVQRKSQIVGEYVYTYPVEQGF